MERMIFLGYWILSLIIWSFVMNISFITVIIFSIIGYHIVCKPLAFLFYKSKVIIINNFFNGFNIFDAFYKGFEKERLIRIFLKISFFLVIFFIAKKSLDIYFYFLID